MNELTDCTEYLGDIIDALKLCDDLNDQIFNGSDSVTDYKKCGKYNAIIKKAKESFGALEGIIESLTGK